MSRLAAWWRGLGPGARVAVAAVAVIVGANLAVEALEEVTGGREPTGPASSSFATSSEGLAAYAELLARTGHAVERLRLPLHEAAMPPGATVVLADVAHLPPEEIVALSAWLPAGGRLVVAGGSGTPILEALGIGALEWWPVGDVRASPIVPLSELEAVGTVTAAGGGAWRRAGPMLPVVSGARSHLLAVAVRGEGRILALADTSPLQNRLLATGDNAAFGLALAGDRSRPVLFAERPHGYGAGTGWAALPADWRWAAALAAAAVLVWMWSRGRRLGPPQRAERPLPPARRRYVDALAATMAKSRRRAEAIEPVRARARSTLSRRLGLGAEPGDDVLLRGATELGLSPAEAGAVLGAGGSEAEVLAAGRALARLEGGRR